MENLYERLGGQESISKVVDVFYDKVLADESVNHFFKDTDMEKQRRHQSLFISWALGGPNQYSGKSMEKAHKGMNLNDEHFGAIANHLASSLREFDVHDKDINEVLEKLTGMKEDILYK
ncbi:group I truncated hemoglobin [Mesobacillus subterraneus]|uniref:Group 1 truncated hemoglobin n=1 Tax=Mesobacillus subterraneus TaxID=285983 RepID=A0A427TJU0_9BACI|nr:group 1 truncated hemoglobin [Mesobacillus subterraneus]RSD24127.1 group 1 truncated hemoglobin [Mesobacillus subterraneus]